MLRELNKNDRIPATDYNELVREYNREESRSPFGTRSLGELYGIYGSSAQTYQVFSIASAAALTGNDEIPSVNVDAFGSTVNGYQFGLVTNGEFDVVASKRCPMRFVVNGVPMKFDVPTGETFTVGKQCGPLFNTTQLYGKGVGFVALSSPITYKTTRKFIWAAAQPAPLLVGRIADATAVTAGTNTAPYELTSGLQVLSLTSGSWANDFAQSVFNTGPAIAASTPGPIVLLAPVMGLGYVIVTQVASASGTTDVVTDFSISGTLLQYRKKQIPVGATSDLGLATLIDLVCS